MAYNKISSKPPRKEDLDRDKFIKAATQIPVSHNNLEELPWNSSKYRDDIKKAFTVALPEKYIIKLQFIKEYTNRSQQ